MKSIIAHNIYTPIRADLFLTNQIKEFSRAQITSYIKKGLITLNNKSFKASHKVLENDIFYYQDNLSITEINIEPYNINLDILYEDEHLAVINKPQGLLVHPGAGKKDITLLNVLMWHFPALKEQNSLRPGIVHRLDKDTCGLMIIAKTTKCLELLSKAFKDRVINKKYLAYAFGVPSWQELEITSGHVRHPYNRLKFFTNLEPPLVSSKVRMAHSMVKVLSSYKNISKLEVTIHTGRTHQIRAHLADRGYPLLGDSLYAKNQDFLTLDNELQQIILSLSGQALIAYSLSFQHPISKEKLSFSLPIPLHLQNIDKFFI